MSVRLEEMRIKRRDSEQWMHHRLLPPELRERVRRYDQYKWLNTRGVDEESLVQSLPKDLRRDIKRHLCLNLVRRVPLFTNMDERLLDAICERLKPSLYTEGTYIVREGDPVQHTFRFYSQQWRTWAAIYIQAAWRRHCRRKVAEQRRKEEEELYESDHEEDDDPTRALVKRSTGSSSRFGLGSTVYASPFAANALHSHRLRGSSSSGLVKMQKPSEPDFSHLNEE